MAQTVCRHLPCALLAASRCWHGRDQGGYTSRASSSRRSRWVILSVPQVPPAIYVTNANVLEFADNVLFFSALNIGTLGRFVSGVWYSHCGHRFTASSHSRKSPKIASEEHCMLACVPPYLCTQFPQTACALCGTLHMESAACQLEREEDDSPQTA